MSDYISRADAIEAVCESCGGVAHCFTDILVNMTVYEKVKTKLKSLPSADAVEVVRCEDCKHLNAAIGAIIVNGEKETVACDYWCNATYPHVTVQNKRHFCSYGERREP